MDKLRLYRINLDYVKYLHSIDDRVRYNPAASVEYNSIRPYVGVVLNINGFNYFAPLQSPKPKHKQMKNQKHIIPIENHNYGIISLNNMIPVTKDLLIDFDINTDPNSNILFAQYIFISKNKNMIMQKASDTYNKRTINPNPFLQRICCNFKLLEAAMLDYCISKDIPFPENLLKDKIVELGNDIQAGKCDNTDLYNRLSAAYIEMQNKNANKDDRIHTPAVDKGFDLSIT